MIPILITSINLWTWLIKFASQIIAMCPFIDRRIDGEREQGRNGRLHSCLASSTLIVSGNRGKRPSGAAVICNSKLSLFDLEEAFATPVDQARISFLSCIFRIDLLGSLWPEWPFRNVSFSVFNICFRALLSV